MTEPTGPATIDGILKQAVEFPPSLNFIHPMDLEGKEVPPRRWAVRDWIPWGNVTGLYGNGGMGKTLIVQQLQTCAAIGHKWFGLETNKMRTLGVYCEDSADELHRRQADINSFYGCSFLDLESMLWLPRLGDDNIMMNFVNVGVRTKFYDQIVQIAKAHRAELVIIDTVADTYGGNENDRSQVRQYVQAGLGRLALEIGGSVLACAHPSRAGLASGEGDGGSTGWNNAFRSRLSLESPKEEEGISVDIDARILARRKANYASRNDQIALLWQRGAFTRTDEETTERVQRSIETVFLNLLDQMIQEGRYVSHSSRAGNYAPKEFALHPGREGYRRRDFELAMGQLFDQRIITVGAYKVNRKTRECIQRAEGVLDEEIPL